MTDVNMFERASRLKLRFKSVKGELTAEQLWDLPLVARAGSTRDLKEDLNGVAKATYAALKEADVDDFVGAKANPQKELLELQMEIIKHVIQVKQEEDAKRKKKAENAALRAQLVETLAQKQTNALADLSEDELKAKIAALDE